MIFREITKRYGDRTVFDRFSAEFADGRITAILGASGEGKTTLLNIVAGLTPYEGVVEGQGVCSYVFQEPRLVPSLTVEQNLRFVGVSAEEAEHLLEQVELKDAARLYPKALSGGMAQRVSIARAFGVPSDTLLMDEPFRSLDLGLKHRLIGMFGLLWKSAPRTTIFVTHAPAEAVAVAHRILVIGRGAVLLDRENEPSYSLTDIDSGLRDELTAALLAV